MNPLYVQLLGFVIWLGAELYAVFNKKRGDTTSEWTWSKELKWPILRPVLGIFLISLVGHVLYGWWLLP